MIRDLLLHRKSGIAGQRGFYITFFNLLSKVNFTVLFKQFSLKQSSEFEHIYEQNKNK